MRFLPDDSMTTGWGIIFLILDLGFWILVPHSEFRIRLIQHLVNPGH